MEELLRKKKFCSYEAQESLIGEWLQLCRETKEKSCHPAHMVEAFALSVKDACSRASCWYQ